MISQSNQIRVGNAARLVLLFGAVLVASLFFKVSASTLLLKLMIVPMFWLSLLGLPALYKNPIAAQPTLSANVIEYYILFVVLFSGFLLVVFWTPVFPVSKLLLLLAGVLVIGVPVKLWQHHRQNSIS